jgi:hypothetical protein
MKRNRTILESKLKKKLNVKHKYTHRDTQTHLNENILGLLTKE